MPWSTTEISTLPSSALVVDHARWSRAGVGDGVGHQVADRGGDLLGVAEDLEPASCRRCTIEMRLESASIAVVVDGHGDDVVDRDGQRRLERVVALQPGQLDDLLHQPGEPVALGAASGRRSA